MGLDINHYRQEYRMLHRLRVWALTVENNSRKLQCKYYGKPEDCGQCMYCALAQFGYSSKRWAALTKFSELINHSDCDGGYISLRRMGIEKIEESIFRKDLLWGDLDELQKEVRFLEKYEFSVSRESMDAWLDFKDDVLKADKILVFH